MSFLCKRLLIKSDDKELVDISFSFENSYALVGQSGSGKSLTLKALLGMLPSSLSVDIEVYWDYDLIRGDTVVMVPQNPFTALSPLTKIKDQFLLPYDKAGEYMKMVDLDPAFLDRFPPELSGGQLQRIIIAMVLTHNPKLLLLDEPTTALDSDTKEDILLLIQKVQKEQEFKTLFVTHDIESSKIFCKEIGIIKSGQIVESGKIEDVIGNPKEQYTKQLIASNFKNRDFRI